MNFEKFPKIPRKIKDGLTITEKLDGTNAQICILSDVPSSKVDEIRTQNIDTEWTVPDTAPEGLHTIFLIGSRNRYLSENQDNYNFWKWVTENDRELCKLGTGRHYGEWYGLGINRGYALEEKRFALFNTFRWGEHNPNTPECCEVVPILYRGKNVTGAVDGCMVDLYDNGSKASPGYKNPEGVVLFSHATKAYLKHTFDNPEGKWKA